MTRVIAMQEVKLNMFNSNYNNADPKISVPQNNADLLSGSINTVAPSQETAPVTSNNAPIDMETQVVNLELNPMSNGSVVNQSVTDQVFGNATINDNTPLNNESVVPETNLFASLPVNNTSEKVEEKPVADSNTPFNVPYQEPVMSNNAPLNVMSDDAYVKYINSLRDKLTNFYNDINMELDKIQEQIVQKSGVSLVDSVTVSEPALSTPNVVTPVQDNIFNNMPSDSIVSNQQQDNLDQTMVIPGNVISEAYAEMQNGMAKAA